MTCPPLTTPDGTYRCSMGHDGGHIVGDTCTLTCDDGFEPSDSVSRQCGNDGSWTGSDPTCDRGQCLNFSICAKFTNKGYICSNRSEELKVAQPKRPEILILGLERFFTLTLDPIYLL